MKSLRRLATTTAVAAAALSLTAGPALAKSPKASYSYVATIDCGAGQVQVGSGDDLWAPLVDLETGKAYQPVAWHVSVDGMAIDATTKGANKKHAVDCSYSDGVATGTVTVKKA
jgi:hypothetical protein